MAEAKIKLPNGTEVAISGSPEEIATLMALYDGSGSTRAAKTPSKATKLEAQTEGSDHKPTIDLTSIINTINDCDEAELIEKKVLDNPDVVSRILMCLYVNEKYFGSEPPMTTGEISKVLKQLGVPIATANVSTAISRKANSYVMFDGIRTKGAVVRYSLNRRGIQYFEGLLSDTESVIHEKPHSAKKSSSKKPPPKTKPGGDLSRTGKSPSKAKKSGGTYKPKYNTQLDLLGLSDFVKPLNLKNNTEYVISFYKFLREKAGLGVVDGDDIFTCFSELKSVVKIPGSFMNTLRNGQNRDHVIAYDRGFVNVCLTPKGENLFNHEIIKREKESD